MRYAFVAEHRQQFCVRTMCRCLSIHTSGFYAWLKNPLSKRAQEDIRQTQLIEEAWKQSGKVYGYRKLHDDLLVVLQALHMAVWRRKPRNTVLVHSDQGSQFTGMDRASFLRHHNLVHSMSRRGNCHDNAVAESFFNLLKHERVRRRTYSVALDMSCQILLCLRMD